MNVNGQKRAMVLDLWMASGRDSQAFESFCDDHGWPLVWSLLLAEIRDAPVCWEPLDHDDLCVLMDGHSGPHYGADDVAAPIDLPPTKVRPRS